MKKSILFLVLIMIFTMIVPAQGISIPENKSPSMFDSNEIYGKYVVSVKINDEWQEIGSLSFGKHPSTQTINLGRHLNSNPIIKLEQDGGGVAYLDTVLLGGSPAVKVNDEEGKLLDKLSREDLDITPVGEEGIVLEFTSWDDGILTVVGRIEPVVIGKEPLQFPMGNTYKNIKNIEEFYTYTLDSNIGTVIVDGNLEEIKDEAPFVTEYRVPGSGHPAGDTYFWVMNDDENLYVAMDVTIDNTYDGDKDYAKVYINTNEGTKEFKVSVPETIWGNTSFTYTDKVAYEHKVYEFAIPLSEIGDLKEEVSLAFAVYGTAIAAPRKYNNPDLAYDPHNDVYVCVYEGIYENYDENNKYYESRITAEVISSAGEVISYYPVNISSIQPNQFTPSIAYDDVNKTFLVVWTYVDKNEHTLYGESDWDISNKPSKVYATPIKIAKGLDGGYYISPSSSEFNISGNTDSFSYTEVEPDVVFNNNYEETGIYNGSFLVVWSQKYTYIEDSSDNNTFDIYGRFIFSNGIRSGDKGFVISKDDEDLLDQTEPSVCYNSSSNRYMVTWVTTEEEGDPTSSKIYGSYIDENGNVADNMELTTSGICYNPNISVQWNGNFILTYVRDIDNKQDVYGSVFYHKKGDFTAFVNKDFKISNNEYSHYVYQQPVSVSLNKNMMTACLFNSCIIDGDAYGKLVYINNFGEVDENIITTSSSTAISFADYSLKSIDISSNGENRLLIAYVKKGSEEISYEAFGESPTIDPYIKFDKENYQVELGEETDFKVLLYNQDNPEGIEITGHDNMEYITDDIVEINKETGKITGLIAGTTTVTAIYFEVPIWDVSSEKSVMELPSGDLTATATITVTELEPEEPSLTFVPNKIEKYVGEEFSVKINYFNGFENKDVTEEVIIIFENPNLVTFGSKKGNFKCIAPGETTLTTTYAGITATASLKVSEKLTSTPTRDKTPIGQILVDKKVIESIYKEDVKAKNNTYTFKADKEGKSANLWLDSKFYSDLADDYPNRIIKFNWGKGTYTLPLNCDEVLKEIDSSAKKVHIFIENVTDDKLIESAGISAEGMGAAIISDLIDFSVFIEKSKGNVDINSLDFYAECTINKLDEINRNISTAMKFDVDNENLTFAPSVFDDDFVTVKYRGNGIFTVIENPQTFKDITSHWAKINIEKLATRNVAFGRENNNFAPDDYVTRAEFAVMITRALGITEEEGSSKFNDVSNEWFAKNIGTAFEAGLINGRNDENFYPNEKILRKDMAVMINNALKFANSEVKIADIETRLAMFKDNTIIDDYAKESVAVCAEAGIILGRDTKNFDPNDNATRAEASAIIERMLKYLDFIN